MRRSLAAHCRVGVTESGTVGMPRLRFSLHTHHRTALHASHTVPQADSRCGDERQREEQKQSQRERFDCAHRNDQFLIILFEQTHQTTHMDSESCTGGCLGVILLELYTCFD